MKDYKELNKDKHFCMLPWVHMHMWPNGITYPCCLATNDYTIGNTNTSTFKELWNSERMRELRRNMLDGKPTSGCSRCYEHEENGSRSMRMNMNMDYFHHYHRTELTHEDGSLDDIYMAYMDIRFSNICNMKCRTCGPELSSFWVDDAIKLGRYSEEQPRILKIKPTLEQFWSDVEPWIDTVERIYFAGGEPLIMDEHYKILEHLIEIGKTDIQIAYNTNFSKLKYKRKDVIQLWQHFEHVKVGASLDAMGPRAELMRAGTKWDDMMRNRERILEEAPHVQFQISSTVSAYNAWHAADFYSDWIDRGWVSPDQVDINILLFPEWQRPEILPEAFRKEIQEKLRAYSEKYDVKNVDKNGRSYSALNALIDCLNKDKSELISEFVSQNDRMDAVREEKLFDIFPELEVLKNV